MAEGPQLFFISFCFFLMLILHWTFLLGCRWAAEDINTVGDVTPEDAEKTIGNVAESSNS